MAYDRKARLKSAYESSGEVCDCGGDLVMLRDSCVCVECGLTEGVEGIADMVVKEKDKAKRDKAKKSKLKELKAKLKMEE